jgi:hypothetical protein
MNKHSLYLALQIRQVYKFGQKSIGFDKIIVGKGVSILSVPAITTGSKRHNEHDGDEQ